MCRHRLPPPRLLAATFAVATAMALSACGAGLHVSGHGEIEAVGAENQYASVIAQVGGRYVTVTSIIDNPSSDPHTFETSPAVASAIGKARLIVQNGLGYDSFMNQLEAAAPAARRKVIDVQRLLGLPDSLANPHLWYRPDTMESVAGTVASKLARIEPAHAAYFRANAARLDRSLQPWSTALAGLRRHFAGVPVAVTEPVANYLLRAAGATVLTPFALEADVMNGVDPAAQAIAAQDALLDGRRVKMLVYNQQVTDSLTELFLSSARAHHIPVVGVYETMPGHGYDYQRWMVAETRALQRALSQGISTTSL